ncbi:hypothetical protein GCM10007169_18290 [Shewanella fodinae]|nr:hypothetical protein GCM10007169_18290 [Shewanella fodinae]
MVSIKAKHKTYWIDFKDEYGATSTGVGSACEGVSLANCAVIWVAMVDR